MKKFLITGGNKLYGTVEISGAKKRYITHIGSLSVNQRKDSFD